MSVSQAVPSLTLFHHLHSLSLQSVLAREHPILQYELLNIHSSSHQCKSLPTKTAVTPPAMKPNVTRRQNSSCDSCHRSKRRCIVPDDNGTTPYLQKSCNYCTHLGRTCTFRFATARTSARRRHPSTTSPLPDTIEPSSLSLASCAISADNIYPDLGISPCNEFPMAVSDALSVPSECLQLDFLTKALIERDDQLLGFLPPEFTDLAAVFSAWSQTTGTPPSDSAPSLFTWSETPSCHGSNEMSPLQVTSSLQQATTSRDSPNRAVDLLDSVFDCGELDGPLNDIYEIVFGQITSRFLAHGNNEYASTCQYSFKNELCQSPVGSEFRTRSGESTPFGEGTLAVSNLELPAVSNSESTRITLVGIARFLDNFGNLFGNPLSKIEQKRQEQMLVAVCTAFALQWLPSRESPDPLEDRFKDAWHEAHCLLAKSNTMSYRYIFSILLFQMIVDPRGAKPDVQDELSPMELLNSALGGLQRLEMQVKRYCKELPAGSRYQTFLEISIATFKWWGYVRDTITSIQLDRPCVLLDTPYHKHEWVEDTTLNESNPGICEEGAGDLFRFFRLVIELRTLRTRSLDSTLDNGVDLRSTLTQLYATVEKMRPTLSRWLLHLECGSRRSRTLQASSALLLMFWAFGILSYVEQLPAACDCYSSYTTEFSAKRDLYLSDSVDAMIRVARVMENGQLYQISEDNLRHKTSESVSCMIHANSTIIITALVKGIKHALVLNSAAQLDDLTRSPFVSEPTPPTPRPFSIQPLVAWLSDMTTTVSGSLSAAAALRGLVREHGDSLMDYLI